MSSFSGSSDPNLKRREIQQQPQPRAAAEGGRPLAADNDDAGSDEGCDEGAMPGNSAVARPPPAGRNGSALAAAAMCARRNVRNTGVGSSLED